MKNKIIFKALNFVFLGIALLLINFEIFDFKWKYFSCFPAILLIYMGLMIALNYFVDKSWCFLVRMVIFFLFWALAFLQLSPYRLSSLKNDDINLNFKINADDVEIDEDFENNTNFSQF